MKLRLSALALLFVISACAGGGNSVQSLPATQPQTQSHAIPANINTFGFGTVGTGQAIIQLVITAGTACDAILSITNSLACDAIVFIPNGQAYSALPGFSYSASILQNGTAYFLDLYQGVATCFGTSCSVGPPFTKLVTNLGESKGYKATGMNTIGEQPTAGTNGFPFTALGLADGNVGYVVNLRP